MGRRYEKPPIAEALCEFRFDSGGQQWDMTIPGVMYGALQDQFPVKKSIKVLQANLIVSPDGPQQQVLASDRAQLFRPDEKALVQVAENLLVINRLPNYEGWTEFSPMVSQAFHTYARIAQPACIKRIGVRYINSIEIADDNIDLSQYFEFRPTFAPGLPKNVTGIICGVQIPYPETNAMLRVQLTGDVTSPGSALKFILDLDFFTGEPCQIELDNALEWVASAHTSIELAFEACISDRLRQMFGEIKDE